MFKGEVKRITLALISACLVMSVTGCTLATPESTITANPTLITPSPQSTEDPPIIRPSTAISVENATQLQLLARLGNGRIHKIAIAPDGMTLAVVSSAGVYLYDIETREGNRLDLDASIYDIAIDPSGRLLAVATDTSLELWDMDRRQLLYLVDTLGPVFSINFDVDGNRLATGGEYAVRIWDIRSRRLLQELNTENSQVLTVGFNPEGTILVSGGSSGLESNTTLQLWDLNSGQVVHNLDQTRTYYRAVFSPDGSLIASANSETSRLWETSTGKLLQMLLPYPSRFSYNPRNLAFSTDGKTIIGDGGLIQQWNLEGELINVMRGTNMTSYKSDGQKIVSQIDTTFEIWDLSTGQIEREFNLPNHSGAISDLAFSPDGSALATVAEDDMLRIWDVESGQLVQFHLAGYEDLELVAFHPSGEILAYGGCSGIMTARVSNICNESKTTLWDISRNRIIRDLKNYTDVIKIAFSPDGQILAASVWKGVSPVLLRYDLSTGETHEFEQRCLDFVFNPDGRFIAANCNNRIHLLDADTGHVLREFMYDDSNPKLAFSPDGKLIASAGDTVGTIQIWDISGNTDDIPPKELKRQENRWTYSMNFGVDGRLLAVGAEGYFGESSGMVKRLELWDVLAGKLLLAIYTPAINVSFSQDGALLATGGDSGIVRLWGIKQE